MTTTATTKAPLHKYWPRLTGRQEPTYQWRQAGDESDGRRCANLGKRAGKRPMPWQKLLLLGWLARDTSKTVFNWRGDEIHPWVHDDCVLVVARQNGKTLLVILRVLFGLFVLHERIVFSAHRWATAEDICNRTIKIILARRQLRALLAKDPTCSGGRGLIELKSGAKVGFITRSADLGRGFDEVDLVIFDEAYNLTQADVDALLPTQLAAPNPQTIYLSSPANQKTQPNCLKLAEMRRLGLRKSVGVFYAEWEAPEGMPRDDVVTQQTANPAFGMIHTEAKVAKILRQATTPEALRSFDIEILGRGDWPPDPNEQLLLIDRDRWAGMAAKPKTRLIGDMVVAVARQRGTSLWCVAAAQYTSEGRAHVEVGFYDVETPSIVCDWLETLIAECNPAAILIQGRDDAMVLKSLLMTRDIEPDIVNGGQWAVACQEFLDWATTGQLSHVEQELLADSVICAQMHELPAGGFIWDEGVEGPLAPLRAATLALHGLLQFGQMRKPLPAAGRVLDVGGGEADYGDDGSVYDDDSMGAYAAQF